MVAKSICQEGETSQRAKPLLHAHRYIQFVKLVDNQNCLGSYLYLCASPSPRSRKVCVREQILKIITWRRWWWMQYWKFKRESLIGYWALYCTWPLSRLLFPITFWMGKHVVCNFKPKSEKSRRNLVPARDQRLQSWRKTQIYFFCYHIWKLLSLLEFLELLLLVG